MWNRSRQIRKRVKPSGHGICGMVRRLISDDWSPGSVGLAALSFCNELIMRAKQPDQIVWPVIQRRFRRRGRADVFVRLPYRNYNFREQHKKNRSQMGESGSIPDMGAQV
ncbi:hypothetical protein AVEN_73600-1 [Araneus ventricosus]|uniref:Uncharacterized protein n=1 Tax=Araneus ventricosus TaxID=182803 RepID=A0A4Y2SR13_ARAVE|nr:hypothetical protein AVEN_73600-1 [Araneus ventricosus]